MQHITPWAAVCAIVWGGRGVGAPHPDDLLADDASLAREAVLREDLVEGVARERKDVDKGERTARRAVLQLVAQEDKVVAP